MGCALELNRGGSWNERSWPLGPESVPSSFVNGSVEGPVLVQSLGLEGDEQADLRMHGGTDKAEYGYAVSNYPRWPADVRAHAALFVPGGVSVRISLSTGSMNPVYASEMCT